MAGPVFSGSGARATSASAATIAPAKPTVDGAHGKLYAAVTSKNNAAHSTATAGWSRVGSQINSGASYTASLWEADEGAGAPTFTWTGAAACSAQIAYYSDPANSVDTVGATSSASGTANPHTSPAITSTRNLSLAIYIDVAAANTALTNPAGWTQDINGGSGTDAGRTTFGSKALATSGTSSGANSTSGAAAAWVQWQIEIRSSAPAAAAQASKIEAAAFIEPLDGADASKIEAAAWLEGADAAGASKLELVAWFEPQSTTLDASKIEVVAWLEPGASIEDPGFSSIIW